MRKKDIEIGQDYAIDGGYGHVFRGRVVELDVEREIYRDRRSYRPTTAADKGARILNLKNTGEPVLSKKLSQVKEIEVHGMLQHEVTKTVETFEENYLIVRNQQILMSWDDHVELKVKAEQAKTNATLTKKNSFEERLASLKFIDSVCGTKLAERREYSVFYEYRSFSDVRETLLSLKDLQQIAAKLSELSAS